MKKIKKMFVFAIAISIAIILNAEAKVQAGHLTDFTKSGFVFWTKDNEKRELLDLADNICRGGFSFWNEKTNEFILHPFLNFVPSENNQQFIEIVIKELKESGEKGMVALPAFTKQEKRGDETHTTLLLTSNLVMVQFQKDIMPEEILKDIVKNYFIYNHNPKDNNGILYIALTIESNANPFEVCTMLSEKQEVKFCFPLFTVEELKK